MRPEIRAVPPGPKARKVIARDAVVMSQSMAREYPLVIDRAQGVNVWDVDGNRYLDFSSFIAVMNFGHSHPQVNAAIKRQLGKVTHAGFLDFHHELPVRFSESLLSLFPAGFDRVYLSNSGAESIEAAMKMSRYHTRRKYFIAFYGAFHGRTYGALSLTSSKTIHRKHFGPFLSVIHAPYPNPYRCPVGSHSNTCDTDVIRYIEDEIFKMEVDPEEVAAIFVEPVQGESGYIVPPWSFMRQLRKLCTEHGILLVDDEIQAGCFRTGKFLAIEHFGVKPDIVCMSKAIGGGLPLGATVASDKIMRWPPGSHASTFGGNTLACAAGIEVTKLMGQKGLGQSVEKKGKMIMDRLRELQDQHDIIGDVRGLGLMIAFELVKNRETKQPAVKEREKLLMDCFRHGLLLLPAGESAIRLCPPLTIAEADIDIGLDIIETRLKKL